MIQRLLILTLTLLPFAARADLLSRIKLEDSIRQRVEDTLRVYDPAARVLLRIDYKSYDGDLPGTALKGSSELLPSEVESADISRVRLEVHSQLESLPDAAKDAINNLIPVQKSRIQVEFKKLPAGKNDLPGPLDSQSFSRALEQTMTSWSQIFMGAVGVCFLGLLAFLFYQNSVRLREFKTQIGQLTAALSDLSLGGGSSPVAQVQAGPQGGSPVSAGAENPFENLSAASLQELLADCYWCGEDAYAMWIWKQLSADQRRTVTGALPFMKDYSLFIMDQEPREASHHEHPSYLDPADWTAYSSEDVAAVVRQTPSAWHSLSPMRHKALPLSFREKLSALQSEPSKNKPAKPAHASAPRSLQAKPSWGDLSLDDESSLFSQPDMVPAPLRPSVKSLVWLAQREPAQIDKVLARFDARSLASAWIGPQDVLAKLESCLPEKKRKLVQTYVTKSPGSRQSPVFTALVQEGFRDAA